MKRKRLICLFIGLLIGLVCISPFYTTLVKGDESAGNNLRSRVIRVGYPIQDGFTEKDEKGNYSGYTYEFLNAISQYLGCEFELVEVEGDINQQLVTFLDMLENGEIDILGAMAYSDELAEKYDYAMDNYGTYSKSLCVLERNQEINSVSFYGMKSVRVAVYSKMGVENQELADYISSLGIELEQIIAESSYEQEEMLEDGRADMLLINSVASINSNLRLVSQFGATPFYFATTKGNKVLANEISAAVSAINAANPYFATNLYQKYFISEYQTISFSKEEKEFLKELEKLDVLLINGSAPIQYMDDDGQPKGISVDLLSYIAKGLGVDINFYVASSYDEYISKIENGEPDLVVCDSKYSTVINTKRYMMSIPCMSMPLMLAINENIDASDLEGKRLAVSKAITYSGEFQGIVSKYETSADCLEAVTNGEADYCYINGYTLQYYVGKNNINHIYSLEQITEGKQNISIGVSEAYGQIMLSIINKSIQNIPQEEMLKAYLYANVYIEGNATLWDIILENKITFITIIIGIVCIMAAIIMFLKHCINKKQMEMFKSQAEIDGLTQVYNNATMREKVSRQLCKNTGSKKLFIIIDLDKFKSINDTYGHHIGDRVLIQMAEACKSVFDKDIIGRIGGDEFAVFSGDNPEKIKIEEKCHALKEMLKEIEIEGRRIELHISLGGVIFKQIEDYEEVFKEADRLMYEIKKGEKNGYLINEL